MKAFTNIFEQSKAIKTKEKEIEQQNITSLQKAAEEIKALLKDSNVLDKIVTNQTKLN